MGSALVVAAVKYGLLTLLWLFVIVAFRIVRNDLSGSKVVRTPAASPAVRDRLATPGWRCCAMGSWTIPGRPPGARAS